MPKWNDRQPVAPTGGGIVRPPAPVVDISPAPTVDTPSPSAPPTRPSDPRVPTTVKPPKPEPLERLKVDTVPTTEGIKYEIENIGGVSNYVVMLQHRVTGLVYATNAKSRQGYILVPGLSKLRGVWDALLMIDLEIAHRTQVEFELTLEWLAEAIGKAKIFFGPSDGPIDRLGATIVTPYPRKASVPGNQEDVIICLEVDDVPDVVPDSARMVFQVMRPGDGGIYFREELPVCRSVSYRMKVAHYLPCTEPGEWRFVVSIGTKVIGNEVLTIGKTRMTASKTENPLEEFQARLVS
jgi:hypothetical protein